MGSPRQHAVRPWARSILVTACLLGLGVAVAQSRAATDPAGVAPVEGTLMTVAGEPFSLASLAGAPALLYFWASWCPDCLDTLEALADLAGRLPPDALVVAVNVGESREVVRDTLAPIAWDGVVALREAHPNERQPGDGAVPTRRVATQVGVYGLPALLFLDATGGITLRHEGPLDPDALERIALERFTAEREAR